MCVVGGCECARMNAHVHMVIHIAQMSSHTVRHPEMCVCVHVCVCVCAHVCACVCVCVTMCILAGVPCSQMYMLKISRLTCTPHGHIT